MFKWSWTIFSLGAPAFSSFAEKLAVAERLFSLIRSWKQALVAVAVVHGEVRWPLWRGFNKMSM